MIHTERSRSPEYSLTGWVCSEENPVTAICPRNLIGPESKPRPPLSVNKKKNHNKWQRHVRRSVSARSKRWSQFGSGHKLDLYFWSFPANHRFSPADTVLRRRHTSPQVKRRQFSSCSKVKPAERRHWPPVSRTSGRLSATVRQQVVRLRPTENLEKRLFKKKDHFTLGRQLDSTISDFKRKLRQFFYI